MNSLNMIAPINSLGYGVAASNIFEQLCEMGVDVKLWPIGSIECNDPLTSLLKRAITTRHGYDEFAPSLRIWHQNDLSQHVGKGHRCAMPFFELDVLSEVERCEMRRMDKLIMCSEWARQVCDDQLPSNYPRDSIYVAPLGVDRTIFHENLGTPDPNWTTFLTVGKWEYRKGHDIIAEAFGRAFQPSDRVRLWMMCENPFLSPAQTRVWHDQCKKTPMGHRVSFLPRVRTHNEVAQVMAEADCGVFPARAEGWNLELLEMMSMGKPVITTNYSAHTEFCTPDNSHLIVVTEREVASDAVFFDGASGGQWAKLTMDHVDGVIEYMRCVHNGEKVVNHHGIETAKQFTWRRTATEVYNACTR